VTAPAVGYFRESATPLEAGAVVEAGQVVAEVVGLGLANDVTTPVDGEVVEVLVAAGDAVEFGQVLARVKP
jgi:biotin carboxyl carrier protein